jgi:hypothetical protein
MYRRHSLVAALIGAAFLSTACAPVAYTALGVGSATAVNHTLTGHTYKTFTLPLPQVKTASLSALERMGIRVEGSETQQGHEVVKATGNDRNIEIVLEPISSNSTRMRVIARSSGGILYDSATATEIIMQTERVLENT